MNQVKHQGFAKTFANYLLGIGVGVILVAFVVSFGIEAMVDTLRSDTKAFGYFELAPVFTMLENYAVLLLITIGLLWGFGVYSGLKRTIDYDRRNLRISSHTAVIAFSAAAGGFYLPFLLNRIWWILQPPDSTFSELSNSGIARSIGLLLIFVVPGIVAMVRMPYDFKGMLIICDKSAKREERAAKILRGLMVLFAMFLVAAITHFIVFEFGYSFY